MINIRYAEKRDLANIATIYNAAILSGNSNAFTEIQSDDYYLDFYKNHSKNEYPILVAEFENTLAGFAYICPYRKERKALAHTGEISFYVSDKYRNQGIASHLIKEIEVNAKKLDFIALFGIILDTNQASIKLMEKLGYKLWAQLPNTVKLNGRIIGQVYYGKNLE